MNKKRVFSEAELTWLEDLRTRGLMVNTIAKKMRISPTAISRVLVGQGYTVEFSRGQMTAAQMTVAYAEEDYSGHEVRSNHVFSPGGPVVHLPGEHQEGYGFTSKRERM